MAFHAFHTPAFPWLVSCSERGSEPHVGAVKLAQFGGVEEDPVYVFIHLFEPDLFVAKNFADEDSVLMPTDVAAVVHSPGQERPRVLEARYAAWEHPGTGHIDAAWRFVAEGLMRTLMVEHRAEAIKLLLLRDQRAPPAA